MHKTQYHIQKRWMGLIYATTSKDIIGITLNSFTIQLTKSFSFNVGWTIIYSSNEFVPIMNSFMIGQSYPFKERI